MICDKCGNGDWYPHSHQTRAPIIHCCVLGHGRKREGTPAEYAEAKAAIKHVIGK